MKKIVFNQFDYFPFLIFIFVFSVFFAAFFRIPFDIFYCMYVFFEIPTDKPIITNAWLWIFIIPSAIVICLNWCIILLALKKNNIDNLWIFSLNFFWAICIFGLLCIALLLASVIIGLAYILVTWVLVHWFNVSIIVASDDTAVSKA